VTSASGKIDLDAVRVEQNVYGSNAALHLDAVSPVFLFNNASAGPMDYVSISRNVTPGYTTYGLGVNATTPTALVTEDNH
jgi:hypothetical protein